MHIAMITGDMRASAGGPPQVVLGSAAALARQGHRVTILTLAADPEPALPDGVSLHPFPADAPAALARSHAMRDAVKRDVADFDVLHIHGVWEQCAAQAAAVFRGAGKPVIVSAHGMLDRWSLQHSTWKKWIARKLLGTGTLLRHSQAIVFGTAEERDESRPALPGARLEVIPNGVDVSVIQALLGGDTSELRARAPRSAEWQPTILYFSRIHPKKGLDLLVEAFVAIAPRYPRAGLLVVGIAQDAALQAAIEARIAEAGLSDRIAITTDLVGPAAKAGLSAAQVFALPSHQEGFSMAIVEAMAAGLPLLITDKCHLPEVEQWQAGVVVPDTAAGLFDGLTRLLANTPDQLVEMGENGRRAVAEHFDWPRIADRLVALYRSCGAP